MKAKDLFEALFMERNSVSVAINKYPNKWVHFTDINKLGINPQKKHGDPYGIYFYPCKFFIKDLYSDNQYATSSKYYYICDINLKANGINLNTLDKDRALRIANMNGWDEYLKKAFDDITYKKSLKRSNTNTLRTVGGIFYAVMDTLVRDNIYTWTKLLDQRFTPYIYDNGKGIINAGEPYQIIVLNPSIIKIVDFGKNKDNTFQIELDMINKIADKYNGVVNINNGNIILTIENPAYLKFSTNPYSLRHKISYFNNNHILTTYEKKNFTDLPIEAINREYNYYIGNYLNKSSKLPDNYIENWGFERLDNIFKNIFSKTTMNQFINKEEPVYVIDNGRLLNIRMYPKGTILNINVYMNIREEENFIINVNSNDRDADIIDTIRNELIDNIKQKFNNSTDIINYFIKHLGFIVP